MSARDRLFFALDVGYLPSAAKYVLMLKDYVGGFKIGLEIFMAHGPSILSDVRRQAPNAVIMLDLKLHDIPETVKRAVQLAVNWGVDFCTLHVQQRETIEMAVKATEGTNTRLLGVTVLTSMLYADLEALRMPSQMDVEGYPDDPEGRVYYNPSQRAEWLALRSSSWGLSGFVCAPTDLVGLRAILPPGALLVTPGIRPDGADAGDQKRIATPYVAIRAGADRLVVGRPIRDALDPIVVAEQIVAEIENALKDTKENIS